MADLKTIHLPINSNNQFAISTLEGEKQIITCHVRNFSLGSVRKSYVDILAIHQEDCQEFFSPFLPFSFWLESDDGVAVEEDHQPSHSLLISSCGGV